ncbi:MULTISPECIES: ATP-dependent Clp protease proteolytic subunit [Erwiniaceae]|uniref:ATP-dependent Clp protease proteolytic subunit n=1 Tax=Erwiniaceae TaxID=1903409 RepID=UPI00190C8F50|nr:MULTISPECIES: ATP-dependent Clp protease proteolytic subunit [Erwiniaceae]MBK0091059.1 ATP-dependent Clp protease proteolytic subunit [Erwinia sp. S59]MBK0122603.1 ATP-dependent Clp protease proteolytic subunit [Pantoea sp. S61]MBK0122688.1 ATP-dependent Clp protease proteolytic subunit [Pantoea sp. S61]
MLDINSTSSEAAAASLSSSLMEHLINARKIFITGTVDEKMAKEVVQHLHILAAINHQPITVFINSPGGHAESGDMIFDAIRFIAPEVIMIGSGCVASAGALIYVAAKKAHRYALPNTRFLLHQPSGGMQGPASNMQIYSNEIVRMKNRLNLIFADATGQPIEKIEQDTQRDFWLSAEQALEYGLVNKVIITEQEIAADYLAA